MKQIKTVLPVLLSLLLIPGGACTERKKTSDTASGTITLQRSAGAANLLLSLKKIPSRGFLFGHQDDPLYGVTWEGDSGRSDVQRVTGDYPAVMGFDIGRIEQDTEKNIDNVSFAIIRREIIRQYERGGMITISWHANNPLTGGDSWDVNRNDVVRSVLPGGEKHDLFLGWLDRAAAFFNSLVTADGTKIPVVFRPWHEHTGNWFWWGKDHCSVDEYTALWTLTRTHLEKAGVNQLLYAYSPDLQGPGEIYMERYPGDDYVDVLGLDGYHRNNEEGIAAYVTSLGTILSFMTEEGRVRNKPIALTETGLEAIPIADWWTRVLLPVAGRYPISYVMVWRNARERPDHYYAPYPGQLSADDFVSFYNHPGTLFIRDIPNLYQ